VQVSSGDSQRAPRLSSKNEARTSSESEGEGKDIEGAEFENAEDSSDEETSQDRAMVDDEPQDVQNPLVRYAHMNAAMEADSETDDYSQLLARRFNRRALDRASHSPQSRRRPWVLLSPECSSENGSPTACESQAAVSDEEGQRSAADEPMSDAGATSDGASEPEDAGWSDEFDSDLDLLDEFARCVIVPRARSRDGLSVSLASCYKFPFCT
jgi:hypothetical protein